MRQCDEDDDEEDDIDYEVEEDNILKPSDIALMFEDTITNATNLMETCMTVVYQFISLKKKYQDLELINKELERENTSFKTELHRTYSELAKYTNTSTVVR